jgi:hypothetical protein
MSYTINSDEMWTHKIYPETMMPERNPNIHQQAQSRWGDIKNKTVASFVSSSVYTAVSILKTHLNELHNGMSKLHE